MPGECTREVTLDPGDLRTLRSEDKGQAGACPGSDAGHPLQGASRRPARVNLARTCLCRSHAGSHRGERPPEAPHGYEQRAGIRPRSRTVLNRSGYPHMELRIRRSSGQAEGARVLAGLRSGDGPLSVRVRPSSLKRDCDPRTTSTGEKCLVNVHAKSRLTLEPLRTLRPETKGQAAACPDRTRAIPCTVRAVTRQFPGERDSRPVRAQTTGKNRRSRPGTTRRVRP